MTASCLRYDRILQGTKNGAPLETALAIYENTKRRIATSGSYAVTPYVIPDGMMTHGVHMIFSFFYTELGRACVPWHAIECM